MLTPQGWIGPSEIKFLMAAGVPRVESRKAGESTKSTR